MVDNLRGGKQGVTEIRPWWKGLRMRFRSIAGLLALILAVSVLSPAAVGADPFGGEAGGYPWRADSDDHWYCFYSNLTGSAQTPYRDAMAYLDSATDMYDVYTPTCGTSTDVMYLENPNLSAYGIALCVRLVSGSSVVCDAYWVATNQSLITSDVLSLQAIPVSVAPVSVHIGKTIRHETGHTAGLTHSPTTVSAMRSGILPDYGAYNFVWWLYEPHHINDHINPTY